MTIPNNGTQCAFPTGADGDPGLTKREYFAGLAMQGLCANSVPGSHRYFPTVAIESIMYADALLTELEKAR